MPRYLISNSTGRRSRLRTSTGLVTLMPGSAGPADGYEMAPALARYYAGSGLTVEPLDAEPAKEKGGATLDDLDADATLALAEAEKIDLGDLDLAEAAGLVSAKAIIAKFRALYTSGNADALRSQAEKIEGIDADAVKAATTKYALVNLIIAAQGAPGSDG